MDIKSLTSSTLDVLETSPVSFPSLKVFARGSEGSGPVTAPSRCSCSAALVPAEAAAVQGKGSPAPPRSLSISFRPFGGCAQKTLPLPGPGVAEGTGDHLGDIVSPPGGCVGMEHGWSLLASHNRSPRANHPVCPQIWGSWEGDKKGHARGSGGDP